MKKNVLLFLMFACTVIYGQQEVPLVMVTGEGTVNVTPDKVVLQARVEHEGNNVNEVRKNNDKVVASVIDYLKKQGIKEKNIKTTYLNLGKNYDYQSKTYNYSANQSIAIVLEDISKYENIVAGLFQNGLNRIDGIQFQSSKVEQHKNEARRKAVLNAKEKAELYATTLGQSIAKVYQVKETETNNFQPMYRMEAMKMDSAASEGQVLSPGEMEIKIKVDVSFHLN